VIIADQPKKVAFKIIEGTAAVLMVLFCFLIFTDLVEFIFPTALIHPRMPGSSDTAALSGNPGWRHLLIEKNGAQDDLGAGGHLTAKVMQLVNDLKYKRAAAVAWETGREGMALFNQDSVQTLDSSSAWIQFDRNSTVRLGERTLITIKHVEEDLLTDGRRTFLLLLQGSLRSRIAKNAGDGSHIRLQTPGAVVYMHSSESPTETRVVVDKDQSATIAVYQGTAQISVQGSRIEVNADQAVRIPANGPPSAPLSLPHPVVVSRPEDGRQFIDKGRHVRTDFSWQSPDAATRYHFMIARDGNFSQIVAEEYLAGLHLTLNSLEPGIYYWRVSAANGDIEGPYSRTRHFYIISELPPPVLDSQQPPEKIYYRDRIPRLFFAWSGPASATRYSWQLSRDAAFMSLAAQRSISSTSLTYSGLAPGTYYWRVGVPGSERRPARYSDVRRLEVIQDRQPPSLEVQFPAPAPGTRTCKVTGRTEPEVKVYVGGFQAEVAADGRFSYTLQLEPGKNVIAVAAVDRANNVTSRSEIVYCKN
jgi:predicted secreted protein